MEFVRLATINGFIVLRIDEIVSVYPGANSQSVIRLKDGSTYISIWTPSQVYNRLEP